MESTGEQSGLLHQILPPRLEDAGLEDPALPPESIHQAFLKAAAAVKSRAASIFSSEDDAADCVGIEPENHPPGPCIVEKGRQPVADDVKVGGGGVEEVGDDVVVGGGWGSVCG
ncbi:uncharacterized protein LOC130744730 [Lotus japonicus]|uniref:uncharacterized protein LOC130744730 n=1 Tax=Lotus japonicus TaxID=34305 RepID=UPI0025854A77|nr:uncharacterized protein LOC130744730 [Lotus japonicus]